MEDKYYGVLLEEISSNFKLVLEGHVVLDRKIDTKFEELSAKRENGHQ